MNRGRFEFSLDSLYIFYIADQEVDNRAELFRVPVGGGQSVKYSDLLVAGGNVPDFRLDPKGQRILYLADQTTNEVYELWSIGINGSLLYRLNGPLTAGGNVGIYEIDPASNRVVYSADQETNGKYELYSVKIDGTGGLEKLNPPIALQGGGNSELYSEFSVHPAGFPVVVFVAREAGSPGGKVYMVPTAGGTPTQLNVNLLATQRILGYRISPLGDRVVINVGTRSGSSNAFKGNLYSVLIGGGGTVDLTEPADPLYGVDGYSFRFTGDGKYVVYQYQKNAAGIKRLKSSTVLAGVRATLYQEISTEPPLYTYGLSDNSQWVIVEAGTSTSSNRLSAIPIGGGGQTNYGPGTRALIMPDSSRVVFSRFTGSQSQTDLFSVQIFGGDQRDLSGLQGSAYVGDTKVSADRKWIVYSIQLDGRYELRASDGRAAQPPAAPSTPGTPAPSTPGQPTGHRALLPMAQR